MGMLHIICPLNLQIESIDIVDIFRNGVNAGEWMTGECNPFSFISLKLNGFSFNQEVFDYSGYGSNSNECYFISIYSYKDISRDETVFETAFK